MKGFYIHLATSAPSGDEAERMAEIFNQYYPIQRCDGYDIAKIYNQKAGIVLMRDREKHYMIAGFMITVPVSQGCFSRFINGEIFGTGEPQCPSILDDGEERKFFIIDCLMTDKSYREEGTPWFEMIVKSVEYMNNNSAPEAIVAAASDLDTGDVLYKNVLSMKLAKNTGHARIYETTLRDLTDNVRANVYVMG